MGEAGGYCSEEEQRKRALQFQEGAMEETRDMTRPTAEWGRFKWADI